MKTISPYFTENNLNYDILHIPLNTPDYFSVYFFDQLNSYFSMAVYGFPLSVKNYRNKLDEFLKYALLISFVSVILIDIPSLIGKIALFFLIIMPLETAIVNLLKYRREQQSMRETIKFHAPIWISHFVIVKRKLRQPLDLQEREVLHDQIRQNLDFPYDTETFDITAICKVGIIRSSDIELKTLLRNRTKLSLPGIYFEDYFKKYFGIFAFGDWSGVAPVVVADDFSIHPLIPSEYLFYPPEQHPHYVAVERAFIGFFHKLYSHFPYLRKNDGYYHFIDDVIDDEKIRRKRKSKQIRGVFIPQCVIASSGHRSGIIQILKGKR